MLEQLVATDYDYYTVFRAWMGMEAQIEQNQLQQSKAAEYVIDAVKVLEENQLNLQEWGTLNMHYMKWNNEYMDSSLHETNP